MNYRTILCAAALAGSLLLPLSARAQEDPCTGVADYVVAAKIAVAPYLAASDAIGFGARDVATIAAPEWGQLADAADTSLVALDALTPPPAVADFDRELTETVSVVSNLAHAAEDQGVLAALPFLDALQTQSTELDAAAATVASLECAA